MRDLLNLQCKVLYSRNVQFQLAGLGLGFVADEMDGWTVVVGRHRLLRSFSSTGIHSSHQQEQLLLNLSLSSCFNEIEYN